MKQKSAKLDKDLVDKTKLQIKALVTSRLGDVAYDDFAAWLTQQIEERLEKNQETANIEAIILCITGMFHHTKVKCLTPAQFNRFADLAEKMLMISKITPEKHPASFLWGEARVLRARADNVQGHTAFALWRFLDDIDQNTDHAPVSKSGYHLARSGKLEKAGFVQNAYEALGLVEPSQLSDRDLMIYYARSARQARLLRDFDGLQTTIQLAKGAFPDNARLARELQWEASVLEFVASQDFSCIMAFLKQLQRYEGVSFITEAWMWAYAANKESLMRREPLIKTMRRNRSYEFNTSGVFETLASAMEKIFEVKKDFTNYGAQIRTVFLNLDQISTDKRLLMLGCLTRVATDRGRPDLKQFIESYYKQFSHSVTGGLTDDGLGCVLATSH